jgi:hypothetical protein
MKYSIIRLSALVLAWLFQACWFENKGTESPPPLPRQEVAWSYDLHLGKNELINLSKDTLVSQWSKKDTITGRLRTEFNGPLFDSVSLFALNRVVLPVDDSGNFRYAGIFLFGFSDGNYRIMISPHVKKNLVDKYVPAQRTLTLNVFYVGTSIPYLTEIWPPYYGGRFSTRKPVIQIHASLLGYGGVQLMDSGTVGFRFIPAASCQDTTDFDAVPFTNFDTRLGEKSEYAQVWVSDSGQIPDVQGSYCFQVRLGARSTPASGVHWENYITHSSKVVYDTIAPKIQLSVPEVGLDPDSFRTSLGFYSPEDLRLYRAQIMDSTRSKVLYEMRPVPNSFSAGRIISWKGLDSNGVPLPDGAYTFRLKAIDYAVHSRGQNDTMFELISAIPLIDSLPISPKFDSLWNQIEFEPGKFIPGINGTVQSVGFRIKRPVPILR